jgi:hypothetical protein
LSSPRNASAKMRPRRVQVRIGDTLAYGYVWDWSVDNVGTWWVHVWCRTGVGELPRLRTFRRTEVLNAEPDV